MSCLPIIGRELREEARRGRTRGLRVVLALTALELLLLATLTWAVLLPFGGLPRRRRLFSRRIFYEYYALPVWLAGKEPWAWRRGVLVAPPPPADRAASSPA